MNDYKKRLLIVLFVMIALLACGVGGTEPPAPTAPVNVGEQSAAQATAAPASEAPPVVQETTSGAATNIEEASRAVIQIEAQGSFVDPQFGLQLNAAGRGSGFIIDPSGIAVTNNHVVTGAALIKVFIPGENQPRNARILGVSECSDLAVIEIEGDNFPYLEWYRDPINVGLDLYVAGYPLGNPEYTLTRGIVSKANANGRYTPWSSIESVLEYDANTNPGNSGGPVITAGGQVLAVHYAGNSSARQAFGISSQLAIGVVEQLQQGRDVDSIGINSQAVMSEDGSISGIWVSSVKSGSPADRTGVRPGDILTKMEGLVLATDGSMADYCDILRSHSPEATLSVEILRFATEEVWEGQLNGRPLALAFSFARQLGGEAPSPTPSSGGSTGGAPSGGYTYTFVQDESGLLELEIPTQWRDVDGGPWVLDNEIIGVSLVAAPSLDNFYSSWTTPGVTFRASAELGINEGEALEFFDFTGSCEYGWRETYADALYSGYYDVWTDCGGEGVLYIVLAVMPEQRDFLILVEVQIVSDDDLEALDRIMGSFIVLVD